MITATEAFGSEPCEKDEWRNRILLSVGKMHWHISRKEAKALAQQLEAALKSSEPDVFEGILHQEHGRFFLENETGVRTNLHPRDWSIARHEGKKVRVIGREKESAGIYLHEYEGLEE